MGTVTELLADLSRRGVSLWADGDELRVRAPKNSLTAELRTAMKEGKDELLAVLRERERTFDRPTAIAKIEPAPEEMHLPFPLTDMQQAIWAGKRDAFEIGNLSGNGYIEIETVALDWDRFERAWHHVIARHGMLRAIVLPDGQNQILPEVPEYQIEVLDLRGQPADVVSARLEELRREMPREMFTPHVWPLFRLRATRLDGDRTRLHYGSSLLVADSLSLLQILRELAVLYSGGELAPLRLSTRDYVVAKTELKGSPFYERALEYWRQRLPTLPPPPELPIELPRSGGPMTSVALNARLLDREPWERLKARIKQAGLMPGAALLTAFCDVAAVWSKTDEFSINAPFWDRLPIHEDVSNIVGSFALPNHLRVTTSPGSTFLERARRLQKQLIEDLEHCRYVSGVQVMRELAKAHGGTPRRNTYVVFNSVEMSSVDISALGQLGYTVSQTPQVYLEVRSAERNGGLEFTWDVLESVFPPRLAQDLLDAFVRHVRRLAEVPTSWEERSRRHIVPTYQREQEREVNATAAAVPGGLLLHNAFAAQAAQRPQHPAVVSTSGTLTYAELDRHSTRLGRWLRDQGVTPNTLVAVVMEKGWEQVAAVLGILKSGAAYLPLDASLPRERLHRILEAGEVGIVLTQETVERRVSWPGYVRRLCVDTQALEDVSEEPLPPVQREDDLAYVIFTSGSTGAPKGVMISHRSALNTIIDINERFEIGPHDSVFGISSLSFDLSVYDVFGTLAAGATLVLPDESGLRDPSHWLEMMRQGRVTVWDSVPGFMRMLVEYADGVGLAIPGSLRLAMLSGDWIPVTLPDQLRRLAPGVSVISLGGATEASIWSILHPIDEVDPDRTSIPYGKPMVNQQIHVLDREFDMRPVWVPGDLYIGGVGVADGYWRNDEATNAAFITHPETGERLYRTGDLGRRLPDGSIELLGREDFQVKIGGYRIELGEIESTLREHKEVREAVVLAVDEEGGNKRLVAYVVASGDTPPEMSELRTFIRDKLPEYMVPKTVIMRDQMPLTANGKIDRAALAAADIPAPAANRGPVAARTPLEQQLAQHWCEVLGISEVGIYDSFFDLSEDSLQAVNIVSKISASVGKQLGVRFLFAHPTIAELSAALDKGDIDTDDEETDAKAGGAVAIKKPEGIIRNERRDLLTLHAAGKIAPVDGVGVLAMPAGLFERAGINPGDVAARLMALDIPQFCGVIDTHLGRIATIMVPRLDTAELYLNRQGLVDTIVGAVEVGARLGAKNISLSGLLVSATDYARAVQEAVKGRKDLPPITSGHDTTSASVLLVVENLLKVTGRRMDNEVLGILGVGSVGRASMHMLLSYLPHPRTLILCDPYAAVSDSQRGRASTIPNRLKKAADECRTKLGYQGEIKIIGGTSTLPEEFYEATLISADTNAPDIVEVARLRPGTMLVDDSIPPCFDRDLAMARIEEHADVMFAQGDVVRSGTPMDKLFSWPPLMYELAGEEGVEFFVKNTPDASSIVDITSSVLSNLIVGQEGVNPVVGPADPDRCHRQIEVLRQNGYVGGPPQCDGLFVSAEAIARFRQQFGVAEAVAATTK